MKTNALPYDLRGRYGLSTRSGAITTIAAFTATAGHVFTMRWDPTDTTKRMYLRYLAVQYQLTTAFGTDQEVAFGLVLCHVYSAAYTGGTAIDVGGTNTNAGKRFKDQATSLVSSARIADTAALTVGTCTPNPNPISVVSGFPETIGDIVPDTVGGTGGMGVLWDSRGRNDYLSFGNDEGFIIANIPVQGATGVGNLLVEVEWDEGTPNGQ